MKERFRAYSAVMLMLIRKNETGEEILLQKRKNTEYYDGYYDVSASGHVEDGESMKMAMCREAKEELGIIIEPNDLEFVCIIHKNTEDRIYYNGYFKATKWKGIPKINEPEKNEEIKWVKINDLPEKFVNDRKDAISNYLNGIKYSEFGW